MDTNNGKKGRFRYNKLFKLLIVKGIKKKGLCELAEINATALVKFGRGRNTDTEILCKICFAPSTVM